MFVIEIDSALTLVEVHSCHCNIIVCAKYICINCVCVCVCVFVYGVCVLVVQY